MEMDTMSMAVKRFCSHMRRAAVTVSVPLFLCVLTVASGVVPLATDSAQATRRVIVCDEWDARREALRRYPGSEVIRVQSYRTYFLVTVARSGRIYEIEIPLDC